MQTAAAPAQRSDSVPPEPAHPRGRVLAGLGLALLGAGLWTLAMPPFTAWPLIWFGFVPVIVAQHRVLPERWSGLGFGVGVGAYLAGQFSVGLAQGHVAFVFQLLPLYMALVVWALAWRTARFHRQTAYRWIAISTPVAWVALDFARASGNATMGGTFANPAYAMWQHPGFLQPLAVFSIYGLELLIVLSNWALAALAIAIVDRRRGTTAPGPAVRVAAARTAAIAVAVAVTAWGVLSAAMIRSPRATVTVAAVQPGKVHDKTEELAHDVAQTQTAAARGARLVVWREVGLNFEPQRRHTAELAALARSTGAHLVIGYGLKTSRGHLNEATLLTPDGRFLGRYGKEHPGTFAGDYSDTGGTFPVYSTPLGKIATIICYDLDFTDTARHMARRGAQIVATPSSDVPTLSKIHYTHLVYRAIENRVSMVKADSRFDSAIIDPYGRVLAVATDYDGHLQATLVAKVPLGPHDSPYVHLGDWVGWVCLAGLAAFLVVGWRARRRARAAGTTASVG
ncbi:MAG: nitrilase-related carbon-nitrogen hydrolase [Acidimicrobiia bacterium]